MYISIPKCIHETLSHHRRGRGHIVYVVDSICGTFSCVQVIPCCLDFDDLFFILKVTGELNRLNLSGGGGHLFSLKTILFITEI